MRFKDRYPKDKKDRHPKDKVEDSSRTKEIGDALVDDEEVVVDEFKRVSVFGLEVMTVDSPVVMRTDKESEGRRRTDDRRG